MTGPKNPSEIQQTLLHETELHHRWMESTDETLKEMRKDITSILVDVATVKGDVSSLRGRVVLVSSVIGSVLTLLGSWIVPKVFR